jgi:hypothetical protein
MFLTGNNNSVRACSVIRRQRVVVNPVMWGSCDRVSESVGTPIKDGKIGYIKVRLYSDYTQRYWSKPT